MMLFLGGLALGLIVGASLGVLLLALCSAGHDEELHRL